MEKRKIKKRTAKSPSGRNNNKNVKSKVKQQKIIAH